MTDRYCSETSHTEDDGKATKQERNRAPLRPRLKAPCSLKLTPRVWMSERSGRSSAPGKPNAYPSWPLLFPLLVLFRLPVRRSLPCLFLRLTVHFAIIVVQIAFTRQIVWIVPREDQHSLCNSPPFSAMCAARLSAKS